MTPDPVTVNPDTTLSHFVNLAMLRHNVSFVPVVEDGVLLGHMDASVLYGIDREHWGSTRVGDVFVGLEQGPMVTPDLAVSELLEIILTTGRRKFMVMQDHQLRGVVTLADLTRHLNPGKMRCRRPKTVDPTQSD